MRVSLQQKKTGNFRWNIEIVALYVNLILQVYFPLLTIFIQNKRVRNDFYTYLIQNVLFKIPIIKKTYLFISHPYILIVTLSIGVILRELGDVFLGDGQGLG